MSGDFEALVLVAYGGHGVVETPDGAARRCTFRRSVGRPCCGDRVRVEPVDDESVVVQDILPRRNRFVRADRHQRKHTVAANLDRVLVVIAPRPLPSQDLLDRYLVAVHSLEIEPVIVLNKAELEISEDQPGALTIHRLPAYADLGYRVVRTSCKTRPGVGQLRVETDTGTSILVGQSGVGKSSLVHRLLPDLEIQTGELSRVTGKGTHTTTTTMLYTLPGGGRLIDSPGVWEYGLWRLEDREIAAGFPEFAPYQGACRFNNCRHATEPGCAVKAAVEAGGIHRWRHEAYMRLSRQNTLTPGG